MKELVTASLIIHQIKNNTNVFLIFVILHKQNAIIIMEFFTISISNRSGRSDRAKGELRLPVFVCI